MNKFLITGSTGYLGRKTLDVFLRSGKDVRSTDLSPMPSSPSKTDYRVFDLVSGDDSKLAELVRDVDTVLHIAGFAHHKGAITPTVRDKYFAVNTRSTERLFRAFSSSGRPKRFVYLSTGAAYGSANGGEPFDESSPCRPDDAYAESKLEAERFLVEACSETNVELVVLRMATLFGEEDPGNMRRLIRSIARNRFPWIGTGKSRKTFIHVDDAALACFLAATQSPAGATSVYNVSGETWETREILEAIYRELKKPMPWIRIPGTAATMLSGTLSFCFFHRGIPAKLYRSVVKWQDDKPGNGEKFCRDFSFTPGISMTEGLKREIEWMRSIGEIS